MTRWDRCAEVLRISLVALGRYRLRTAPSTPGVVLDIAASIALRGVT